MGHLVRVSWSSYLLSNYTWIIAEKWPGLFLFQTSRDSSTEKLLQKLNGWYMEKEGAFLFLLYIIVNLDVKNLMKQYKSGFNPFWFYVLC